MIDERMEEQASLHVLGALSEAEAREFKKAMEANPELQAYAARFSATAGALAGAVPLVEPSPQLRAKILAQATQPQKIITLPERKFRVAFWLQWGFVTGVAILCITVLWHEGRLRKIVDGQAGQISRLNQLAQSLELATNQLQQTVAALQETNRLAGLRIAMLNSLVPDAPKTVAVTLWDDQRQDGIFVAENLKALPADKDYELWVIDESQTPVAAGVFHVDEKGKIRMDFKPSRLIKTAGKFAVTEEIKGGVSSPTMKNLVLASN
jgi:anti-sigma-K factor RskA